jgi:hypothetical protein
MIVLMYKNIRQEGYDAVAVTSFSRFQDVVLLHGKNPDMIWVEREKKYVCDINFVFCNPLICFPECK